MIKITVDMTVNHIQKYSRLLAPAFFSLCASYVARILLPMIAPEHYLLWLGIAQAAWIFAFALLTWVYAPILVKRRIDGLPG
ncbi:MAG TPA: NnrS family protein [Gallionella sp.]|nr:NnrS family protein [Gallionella sp.]